MPHNHSHTHHTPDVDWAEAVEYLDQAAAVSSATDRAVVEWLAPPPGSRVADIGSGAGNMTVLLAAAVGDTGVVEAVDREPALLAAVVRRCTDAGVADWVRTRQQDLAELDLRFAAPPDLIWGSAVVHHLPDQQGAVDRLVASLAPGGRLALSEGGLTRRSLPWDTGVGAPGIEDRLAAAESKWFAAMRRDLPGAIRIPYGWTRVLAVAGLADVTARSFLLDLPAPLPAALRDYVVGSLASRGERFGDLLDGDDLAAWQRLLDPDGPDHLGLRDDLYLLGATTVYVGTRRDH